MYTISFTFTNPKDLTDRNNMVVKELTLIETTTWLSQIFQKALQGTWIINHLKTIYHAT